MEWIIYFLRNKFINTSKKIECSKKIFIDRSDSKFDHCKLINNDEIKNFLIDSTFESIKTGRSIRAKISNSANNLGCLSSDTAKKTPPSEVSLKGFNDQSKELGVKTKTL